jgi:hypothetical protein
VSRWTTKWVRHVIATRFGLADGRERRRQVRHGLGFRRRRRRHRHLTARSEAQVACRAELEELLPDWPAAWELLVVDAATGRRQPPLTAQWCVRAEIPEVPTGDDHARVPGYGAVAPLPGRTHDPSSPEWGQGEVAPCLRPLLASHPGQRLLVLPDRGEQQKGPPGDAVVREAQGRLVLKAQPADAPALHPQERLGTWWRRVVTHHHWCATLAAQIEAIRHCFRSLAGVKDQVRHLCGFKTPESFVASL